MEHGVMPFEIHVFAHSVQGNNENILTCFLLSTYSLVLCLWSKYCVHLQEAYLFQAPRKTRKAGSPSLACSLKNSGTKWGSTSNTFDIP